MTLIGAILKRAKSTESIHSRKFTSPPPEVEKIVPRKKKKLVNKYGHVRARVDARSPRYAPAQYCALRAARRRFDAHHAENVRILVGIQTAYLKGKVDNRWRQRPPASRQYYEQRANFLRHVQTINRQIYKRIITTRPRVVTTASLLRDWAFNRQEILRKAQGTFVLFSPVPTELVEDPAFLPPPGVKRPRVRLTLGTRGGAVLGELVVELLTDVCPATCELFLELLDGEQGGYGYVGTSFFSKVPGMFWSGGDVVYDNGFGCYVQRGRRQPIGAQGLHFSHSMPGLLSMRVTQDDEMCGIFNITFKPLPQFDLRNEVFGRVIRPSSTFDSMRSLGAALSPRPVVEVCAARRRAALSPRPVVEVCAARRRAAPGPGARWVHGRPNTRIIKNFHALPKLS